MGAIGKSDSLGIEFGAQGTGSGLVLGPNAPVMLISPSVVPVRQTLLFRSADSAKCKGRAP